MSPRLLPLGGRLPLEMKEDHVLRHRPVPPGALLER
jgi:hypothetical protein